MHTHIYKLHVWHVRICNLSEAVIYFLLPIISMSWKLFCMALSDDQLKREGKTNSHHKARSRKT